MIVFNDVDLTENIPVDIEDIYVSPIQLTPIARERSIAWGADLARINGGTRDIIVTFALLKENRAEREDLLQQLRDWAKVGAEGVIHLPHFENRHLEAAVVQLPDATYRKWWESKLKIVFRCFNNPYWTSDEQVEVPCGTVFSIGGSAPPIMTINRNGVTPLTQQTYTSGDENIIFKTIPAGNAIIDLNKKTAAIGNTSIMQYYVPTATWITPKVGANQVVNGQGTIKYRERWV